MQLSYRGVKYDYNPAKTEFVQPAVDIKYRGATYRRGEAAKVARLGAIFIYRGATYNRQPDAQVETVQPAAIATTPVTTVEDRARLLNLNNSRALRNRDQVVLARTASEQGFVSLANS